MLALSVIVLAGLGAQPPASPPGSERVAEAMRAFDAVEIGEVWPGFETASIPLMLYDGERTWLRGLSAWPDGFAPAGDIAFYEGRHPVHRSNTAADLEGAWVATFELRPDTEPDAFLRLMVHESFHVHQNRALQAHTEANEASLFTFPTADGEELALRRLEVKALRRALHAADPGERRGWCARFVALRDDRRARLGEAEAAYERALERKEGIPDYVAWSSVSAGEIPAVPARAMAPDGMRDRPYWTGAALAKLLDELRPAWKLEMIADGALFMDAMLAESVADADPMFFDGDVERRVRARAHEDAGAERARRAAIGEEYLAAPGWRVEIAGGRPLWPAGFDPLNVVSLGEGRVLHTRFLKLQNDACSLEVLGARALTEGAGDHPLFNGIGRVVVTGLAEPTLEQTGDITTITADGVRVSAPAPAVEVGKGVIRVGLGG